VPAATPSGNGRRSFSTTPIAGDRFPVRILARRLKAAGLRFATAESCTGGYIAKVCTDLSGSSQWFACALVTYSNESKQRLLDVPAALLARHGAVSEPVVSAMARGALRRSGADVVVAVTGVAGPQGGSPAKPVGTVWFAWAVRRGRGAVVAVERRLFPGDRDAVRRRTVRHALNGVLRLLPR
jgi:nicotinamide-nucleotide amidase